jgi:hypothetical protein
MPADEKCGLLGCETWGSGKYPPPPGGSENGGGIEGGNGTPSTQYPTNSSDSQGYDEQKILDLINLCINDPYNTQCPRMPAIGSCFSTSDGRTVISSVVPYGCYIVGYRSYYDYSKIDWGQFTMDSLGIIADGATFVGIFAPPAFGVTAVADGIQVAQIGYDAIEMNYGSFSWDVFSALASENKLLVRLIPAFNIPIIATSMTYNLHPALTTVPVLKPYLPYIHLSGYPK